MRMRHPNTPYLHPLPERRRWGLEIKAVAVCSLTTRKPTWSPGNISHRGHHGHASGPRERAGIANMAAKGTATEVSDVDEAAQRRLSSSRSCQTAQSVPTDMVFRTPALSLLRTVGTECTRSGREAFGGAPNPCAAFGDFSLEHSRRRPTPDSLRRAKNVLHPKRKLLLEGGAVMLGLDEGPLGIPNKSIVPEFFHQPVKSPDRRSTSTIVRDVSRPLERLPRSSSPFPPAPRRDDSPLSAPSCSDIFSPTSPLNGVSMPRSAFLSLSPYNEIFPPSSPRKELMARSWRRRGW